MKPILIIHNTSALPHVTQTRLYRILNSTLSVNLLILIYFCSLPLLCLPSTHSQPAAVMLCSTRGTAIAVVRARHPGAYYAVRYITGDSKAIYLLKPQKAGLWACSNDGLDLCTWG